MRYITNCLEQHKWLYLQGSAAVPKTWDRAVDLVNQALSSVSANQIMCYKIAVIFNRYLR